MNWKTDDRARRLALLASAGMARADGELNIYNWGNYTSPELIKKFEDDVQGQGHDHRLRFQRHRAGQGRAGGHGFDIVVPSANFVPIWIKEGLLLESPPRPDGELQERRSATGSMSASIRAATTRCRGSGAPTGIVVNTDVYKGDINTSAHLLRPAGRAQGQGQRRARDERRHVRRHHVCRRRAVHRPTRRC